MYLFENAVNYINEEKNNKNVDMNIIFITPVHVVVTFMQLWITWLATNVIGGCGKVL